MGEPEPNGAIRVEIDDGGVIVVHGEIDIVGGPILSAAIAFEPHDRPIIIDLGDVSFIDSSGLRSLLHAARNAADKGGSVVLRSVGPAVTRLLQLTGTLDLFTVESTRA